MARRIQGRYRPRMIAASYTSFTTQNWHIINLYCTLCSHISHISFTPPIHLINPSIIPPPLSQACIVYGKLVNFVGLPYGAPICWWNEKDQQPGAPFKYGWNVCYEQEKLVKLFNGIFCCVWWKYGMWGKDSFFGLISLPRFLRGIRWLHNLSHPTHPLWVHMPHHIIPSPSASFSPLHSHLPSSLDYYSLPNSP